MSSDIYMHSPHDYRSLRLFLCSLKLVSLNLKTCAHILSRLSLFMREILLLIPVIHHNNYIPVTFLHGLNTYCLAYTCLTIAVPTDFIWSANTQPISSYSSF